MKKALVIISIILIISSIGYFLYFKNKYNNNEIRKINDRNSQDKETFNNIKKQEMLEIIKEDLYKKCKHIISTRDVVYTDNVKEEINKKIIENKEYTLLSRSNNTIILRREIDDICSEHYILREKEGYIIINVRQNNEEVIYQETTIPVGKLKKAIQEKIKLGMAIESTEELYNILEDLDS